MRKMSVGVKWRKTKQTMSCNNQRAESSSQKKMIPQKRKACTAWNRLPMCQEHSPLAHPKPASLLGWMVRRARAITFCKKLPLCSGMADCIVSTSIQSKALEQQQPMRSKALIGLSLPRHSWLQWDFHETIQSTRSKDTHQFPRS